MPRKRKSLQKAALQSAAPSTSVASVNTEALALDEQKTQWVDTTQQRAREKRRYPLKVKSDDGGSESLAALSDDNKETNCQLYATTGFTDIDGACRIVEQVVNANECRKNVGRANSVLAMLDGIAPESPLEGLLAAQMTACHTMAMEFSRHAMSSNQSAEAVDLNINRATKLMRTFTAQVEALQKLRNKGQQKITVQHVQVGHGGQAIIGDVSHGGGAKG
jgi:hypothetical protein